MVDEFEFADYNFEEFDNPVSESLEERPEFTLADGVSVAVVDADSAVCDYLAGFFDGDIDTAYSLSAMEVHLGLGSKVVLLGPSCATKSELAVVKEWTRKYPNVATILVTAELTTQLLHRALRVGVKDVLSAPIDEELLLETVQRVADQLPKASQLVADSGEEQNEEIIDGTTGELLTVFSTKGGSGKSVTATNLAVVLARRSNKPVVVIDGHFQFGDIAVMLKLQQPEHNVIDATLRANELDGELLKSLMAVHEPTGIFVLPAPQEPVLADQINVEDFLRVIEVARSIAGHVIIDLPAFFNELIFSVLQISDQIILVAGLDIPNIKNVKIGTKALQMLNVSDDRIHLILNRANSKVKLEVSEVERALDLEASAYIPSDVVVPISVNKGSPVVLSAPKSGVARAFEELATRFVDSASAVEVTSGGRRKFFG